MTARPSLLLALTLSLLACGRAADGEPATSTDAVTTPAPASAGAGLAELSGQGTGQGDRQGREDPVARDSRPEPTPAEGAREPLPAWDFSGVELPTPPPTAPTPSIAPDAETTGRRCVEGSRVHLVLERGGERVRDELAKDAVPGAAHVTVDRGRHAGQPGLPVASLLEPGDAELVLLPCLGDPLTVGAAELRRDPGRWLLVLSGRDSLKLLDMRATDWPKAPRMKNLAVIRAVPTAP
jgi:hypothetical protein